MNMRVLLYSLVIAFQAIVLGGSQHHVLAREFGRYIDPLDHRPRRCMAAVWVGSNIGSQKIDVPIVKENDLRSLDTPNIFLTTHTQTGIVVGLAAHSST